MSENKSDLNNQDVGKAILDKPKASFPFLDLIALSIWFFLSIKLFIFDVDNFIVKSFLPSFYWIIDYKFLLIIGIVSALWLTWGGWKLCGWVSYIAFYPILAFFWKIPYYIYKTKSFIVLMASIDFGISFYQNAKFNFVTYSLIAISSALIFSTSSQIAIYLSIGIIAIGTAAIYINRLITIFCASSVCSVYIKIFGSLKNHAIRIFILEDDLKKMPIKDLNEVQQKKRIEKLGNTVLLNRICLFFAKELKNYQGSGITVISCVVSLIFLLAITIFAFFAINVGLFKLDQSNFSFTSEPNYFLFFYYSFSNFIFNTIPEIIPHSTLSRFFSMLESGFALFAIAILASLILSTRTQRLSDELNAAIADLKSNSSELELFIVKEYNIDNINSAIDELKAYKSVMISPIIFINDKIT